MRIEDRLGEMLKRAVADEPLPREVYETFERRARRDRGMRVAGTLALAAAVVAGVLVVPRVVRTHPVPTATSPAAWKTLSDPAQGFSLSYPPDWVVDQRTSTWILHPASAANVASSGGTPRYAEEIDVVLTGVHYAGDKAHTQRQGVHATETTVGGRPAFWSESSGAVMYRIDWTATHKVLSFAILSSGSDSSFRDTASQVLATMTKTSEPEDPTASWKQTGETGWTLRIPDDWVSTSFEGYTEYHPASLTGLARGENTFAIEMRLLPEYYDKDPSTGGSCESPGCIVESDGVHFDGFSYAVVGEASKPDGSRVTQYRADWPCPSGAPCGPSHPACSTAPCDVPTATLYVAVHASTHALDQQYAAIAEQILESIAVPE